MKISIADNIDLAKIADSGQCFRVRQRDKAFTFITGANVLNITLEETDKNHSTFSADCTSEIWNQVWAPYFDLATDYSKILPDKSDKWMAAATEYSSGIRILAQDPWETLVSFIISQRCSIPAISASVEILCKNFGEKIGIDCKGQAVFSFPSVEAFLKAGETGLKSAKLGYRLPYVLDAAAKVTSKQINLEEAATLPDQDLISYLQQINGVGIKVASCTALFAFHRHSVAPIDTWIAKIINQNYDGRNPFTGPHAGIFQQYAFYYKRAIS